MTEKGGGSPPESPHLSHAEITTLWAKFRAGEVVRCPRDSAGVALAVDGAAKAYRLVCTQCGLASPVVWDDPVGPGLPEPPTTVVPANGDLHDE